MDEFNKSADQEILKQVEKYMDSSFMLLSTMVNEKYSELQENLKQFPGRVVSPINRNIIEASHKLYTDLCNENVKRSEQLKRQLLFRANIVVGIAVLIFILELIRFIRQ